MQGIIAKIERNPGGDWNSNNGMLYSFLYTFQNGLSGTANHKTEKSPNFPGQEVTYEVVGDYQGVSKIKFAQNQTQQQGGGYQQQQAPAQQGSAPAQAKGTPVPGVTVGMALNNAVQLIVAGMAPNTQGLAVSVHLRNIAYGIIRVSKSLEGGWSPNPPQQQQAQQQQLPAQNQQQGNGQGTTAQQRAGATVTDLPPDAQDQGPPPSAQTRQRHEPGPDGDSVALSDLEEDVPF